MTTETNFVCTGSAVINLAIQHLFGTENNPLPVLKNGQVLSEKDKILHEIVSKPPARFTQATLISAMENVQKYMAADEVDLKNAMKKSRRNRPAFFKSGNHI